MLSAKGASIIYETLLSSPGMDDNVKISLQLPRRNVLLLTKIIEHVLATKNEIQTGILSMANDETAKELSLVPVEAIKESWAYRYERETEFPEQQVRSMGCAASVMQRYSTFFRLCMH